MNNLLALTLILVSSTGLSAQIRYAVGQNIVPVYEGVGAKRRRDLQHGVRVHEPEL